MGNQSKKDRIKKLWEKYPGTKQCSYEEILDIVQTLYPGAVVFSRSEHNRTSTALYPKSKKIIARDGSNIKLKKLILDEDFRPEYKRPNTIVDVPPTINVKGHCQKLANNILAALTELGQAAQTKPIIKYDDNGKPIAIRTKDIIYKRNNTIIKE